MSRGAISDEMSEGADRGTNKSLTSSLRSSGTPLQSRSPQIHPRTGSRERSHKKEHLNHGKRSHLPHLKNRTTPIPRNRRARKGEKIDARAEKVHR